MSKFPKIKGLKWLNEDFPDLVAIKVTLVDKKMYDMNLPGMKLPEINGVMNVDLSRLAAVAPWYPEGSDDFAENQCSIDVDGVSNFIGDMSTADLLQAWLFYKNYNRK